MNIQNDITSLKVQGVTDKDIIKLVKLKGAKEEEIIFQLNEFYEKKNSTQVTDEPLTQSTAQFPLLQVIILILLFLIAVVLAWFILAN